MSVNFKPLHDRVVIKPSDLKKMSAGGIVLPTNDERPHSGVVVATGPGKKINGELEALNVAPGNKVMFGKYSGTEFQIDGEDYLVMKEEDVIGVIQE